VIEMGYKREIEKSILDCIDHEEYEYIPGATIMKCPVCDCNYTHDAGISINIRSDTYGAWDGRGDCMIIPIYGECGHKWEVCFGFHKGQTFMFLSNIGKYDINGGD
jgi:hypothetical protein